MAKPQSIIAKTKNANIHVDDRFDFIDFKRKPVSDRYLEELGMKLVKWARQTERAYKLEQFFELEGIYSGDFYRWVGRYKPLEDAVKQARMIIGTRREIGGIENKLNASIVSYTMPMYCDGWKAETVRRAELTKDKDEHGGTKVVVIEKFESSKLVPERKKKDE